MRFYFFIPSTEITEQMIHFSVSRSLAEIPIHTFNNIPFYLLEVEQSVYGQNDVFAKYKPCSQDETLKTIDGTLPAPTVPAQKIKYKGIINSTCSIIGNNPLEYIMPANRVVKGIVAHTYNSDPQDTLDVNVYAPDGQGGWNLQDNFVESWNIIPDPVHLPVPRTYIASGLKIEFKYNRVGQVTAPRFIANMLWEAP